MTQKQRIANKEILIVLNKLNLTNKIPKDILLGMQNNQDENWNFVYIDNVPLEKQRLTRQSIIMFSNLYYMYICEDNTEREKMKSILQENERKQHEETMNRLNNLNRRDNFSMQTLKNENEVKETSITEIKEDSFIRKIINKIKGIFQR